MTPELRQQIKTAVEGLPFITECRKVGVCGLSGGQHIEVEFHTPDPQQARKEVDTLLSELFPQKKFRLLCVRS